MTDQNSVVTKTDLSGIYKKISAGKVRDLYQIDERTLLVVSTDRVSAFDVILNNVSLPVRCWKVLRLILLTGDSVQRLPSKPPLNTLVLCPYQAHSRSTHALHQHRITCCDTKVGPRICSTQSFHASQALQSSTHRIHRQRLYHWQRMEGVQEVRDCAWISNA